MRCVSLSAGVRASARLKPLVVRVCTQRFYYINCENFRKERHAVVQCTLKERVLWSVGAPPTTVDMFMLQLGICGLWSRRVHCVQIELAYTSFEIKLVFSAVRVFSHNLTLPSRRS